MDKTQHPSQEDIRLYAADNLPDAKHMELGEHLLACTQCMDSARLEYKMNLLVENWTAETTADLLWSREISKGLKNKTIHVDFSQEQLAAETLPGDASSIIKHYFSKDKSIIATVEYTANSAEISFETKAAHLAEAVIGFTLVRMDSRKIAVCGEVRLESRAAGIWEKTWKGKVDFSSDLTLLFDY